jgi:hypothetical protein
MNRKEINIRSELVSLERRQRDIEFNLKNRNYNSADPDWVALFGSWQAEYKTNAETIGRLLAELKLINMETV